MSDVVHELCRLASIGYWLNRPIKQALAKDSTRGDTEAAKWLDHPRHERWSVF
jgi:hypothetical protein